MPAAVAIPAAVSLGSSVLGGVLGSSASKRAAATQQQMAQQQAAQTQAVLNQYNPAILSSAQNAAQGATTAAQGAGGRLIDTAEAAAQGVTGAAGQANEFLQPYMQLGSQSAQTLAQMMAPGGDLNRNFTFQDMQAMDPGYQFRIDQANQALARSAAARGGALGGGALRAADQLTQNLASSEYGNAFNRFSQQASDRFGRFSNLVNMGVNTSNMAGGNLMTAANQAGGFRTNAATQAGGWDVNAAQYGGNMMTNAAQVQAQNALGAQRSIADLMTGGTAAQAAGQVGSANAWGSALGGVANAANQVGGYYQGQNLLKQLGYGNPSLSAQVQNLPITRSPFLTGITFPGSPSIGGYPTGSMPNYSGMGMYPNYMTGYYKP